MTDTDRIRLLEWIKWMSLGDIPWELVDLLQAFVVAKGTADAELVRNMKSCRDDLGYSYGCMDMAADYLDDCAGQVPEAPKDGRTWEERP